MDRTTFLQESLLTHPPALRYLAGRRLAEGFPDAYVLETNDWDFDYRDYASEGHCTLRELAEARGQFAYGWIGIEEGFVVTPVNAWYEVEWQGHRLEVVRIEWNVSGCPEVNHWLIARNRELAEAFFAEVCRWNSEIRGEVLVFANGYWQKSESLYRAIQGASFDNLVLPPALKREIRADLESFFRLRETYAEYGVPWKRGVLFLGPPGNGKTHTVKALLNSLGKPCLYVQSLKSRRDTEHASIREVFERARKAAPCLLVLEDLDSLLTDENRSYFLNELDGFAANTGIVTLATTNHPERLDPAILERPSRFDRKYHFDLPAETERRAYLALWNERLQPGLRLPGDALERLAGLTEGFSFAYLKELVLSAMMRWINVRGDMEAVMAGQVATLREQMRSAPCPTPPAPSQDDEDD